MSRFQPVQNNPKSDIVSSCETYITKMLKNKKNDRPYLEQRSLRDKSIGRTNNHLAMCRPVAKPCAATIAKTAEHLEQPSQELLHKEIFNNNMATVEVTVRTVAQQKGTNSKNLLNEKRESWSKLLKQNSDDSLIGSFGTFDPLRTLHFLSKELQIKLNLLCPGDVSIHKIISDMQSAIQRLPPDIVSQLKLTEENCFKEFNDMGTNFKKDQRNETKKSQHTQTIIIGDYESKILKHQLDESASKLEASYKQMETVCTKLRQERDEIENQLFSERETVKSLKKELEDRVSEKEDKLIKENLAITAERNDFQCRIKQLEAQLELYAGPRTQNLRIMIQDLRSKQFVIEQDNTSIRNELTIMKLERDKNNVLLECKDKQIRELLEELENIQQLVCAQIDDYKCKPFSSPVSSISSMSQICNIPSVKASKARESIQEIFKKKEVNQNLQGFDCELLSSLYKDGKCKRLDQNLEIDTAQNSQIEIPGTLSAVTLSTEHKYSPKESHTSIKDLFAEIKRQAFLNMDVTLPSPPRPFVDVSLVDSRINESL